MKKFALWCMMVWILFSVTGCSANEKEAIEKYKSEARYYYEQVDGILKNLNVIDEADKSISSVEDGYFSTTLKKALFRGVCLDGLISINQYYNGLEVSAEEMDNLYLSFSTKEEIDNIKVIIDDLASECSDLKKLLENATEYDSDFIDKYSSGIENIEAQAKLLYRYVDGVESAVHDIEADKETMDHYTEEIENHEKELAENDLLGSQSNPLCVGDSVEVNFIDSGAGRKDDSWYAATCRFTYKGNADGAANLNFELVDQEAGTGIVLGPQYGSGFTFMVVNENLQQDYIPYEGGVYRSEDKDGYVAVLNGGNIDFSVKIENDTSYLVIYYVESTKENLNVSNLSSATEKILWIKIK